MNDDFWNNDTPGNTGPSEEPDSSAPEPEAHAPSEPAPSQEGPSSQPSQSPSATPPSYGAQPPYGGGQPPYGQSPYGQQPPWPGGGYYYSPSRPNQQPAQGPNPQWNPEEYNKAAQSGGGKRPKRNRGLVVFTVLLCSVLLVAVLFLAGYGLYAVISEDSGLESSESELLTPPAGGENSGGAGLNIEDKPSGDEDTVISADGRLSTPEIARRVSPSVVGVVEYGSYYGSMYSASGSGIIISSDAEGIEVILSDGSRQEAWLVGKDTRTDLAVIKVDAQNLPYAEFGNSDQMEIGETVIAIGNPGGEDLSGSVSQGIISGLNRMIKTQSDGYSINCIQTDAAINPGNSGGPLVNQFGQVVGINSAKLVQTEYEGIGFAIPINDAKPIVDQLIARGKVTDRARLGITGQAISYNYAQYYGLPQGIRVISTDQNADISSKGLRVGEVAGDIITHLDGEAVASFDDIAQILNGYKAGDQVELTVYRVAYNGQRAQTFDITITLVSDDSE